MLKPLIWQDLPFGELLQTEIEAKLAPWWPRIFGYHLLKVGALSGQVNSLSCSITRHFSVYDATNASIQADPHHLPIQQSAIDTVLSCFLLEFESDPYQILREFDRVLISSGYIFIVGFNPVSPAFIGKILPKYQTQLPWSGQFFMPSRVKDWLGLLGYQVLADERLMYHSLLGQGADNRGHQAKKSPQTPLWQKSIANWLPSTGSVYLIVARKMTTPLTPIKDKSKIKAPTWSPAPTAGRSGLTNTQGVEKALIKPKNS
ncbi:methyltransferase domain-containing protein [Shewanella vesiculosa]|jgi:SAM-dependent methyltransferase|uniref:class I SAM-dependent methyltransferase n=1 Tax=Shewanella vesiculosa TaxID=518738 RepID=UPI000F506BFE|nr:methyltransferase domain-containing protein [Shewanella vesiculosa]RPA36167.1 methyltransferase domain-containing protein [Shewanella vesiculosa]UJL43839.1 methyltransferase domain-containing protein [Shewanella vesiculosa]